MLPVYSFLFDNVEDVHEEMNQNDFMIPLAPLLGCHVHPHNYFMVIVNQDIKYIGEYIGMKERRQIASWQIAECSPNTRAPSLAECPPTTGQPSQQDVTECPRRTRAPSEAECPPHTGAPSDLMKERRQIPSWQIAECSPNTRAPSLAERPPTTGLPSQQDVTECPPPPRAPSEAECPPHTGAPSDLLGLFRIFLRDNDMPKQMKSTQIPVPFETYHKCIGLQQATRTNAYIWLMFDMIYDIVFISHAETVQYGYSQFGGKGISNCYYLYSQIEYVSEMNEIKAHYTLRKHTHHREFGSTGVCYNSRIYSSLGAFRDTVNKLMHTNRMFQANGYRINQYLSIECFNYIVYKCRGNCVLVKKQVDRVRRIFLSDLAQEKRKYVHQTVSIVRIETAEQLKHFRSILGATFGTGARVTPRLKDGVIPVRLHSVINAVNPPERNTLKEINIAKTRSSRARTDNRKCDLFQISFDHTTSLASISVVFTRMIVGEDECSVGVLRDIGHNALVQNLTAINLVVGTYFLYENERWMVEEISGEDVHASNSDDVMICLKKSIINNVI